MIVLNKKETKQSEIYVGNKSLGEVYVGSNLVWKKEYGGGEMPDPSKGEVAAKITSTRHTYYIYCKDLVSRQLELMGQEVQGFITHSHFEPFKDEYLMYVELNECVKGIDSQTFKDIRLGYLYSDYVKYLADNAFQGVDSQAKNFNFPSIEIIGDALFYGMDGLLSVKFGSGLKEINGHPFEGLEIDSTTIYFYGCPPPTYKTYSADKGDISDGLGEHIIIYVPKSCSDEYKELFNKVSDKVIPLL